MKMTDKKIIFFPHLEKYMSGSLLFSVIFVVLSRCSLSSPPPAIPISCLRRSSSLHSVSQTPKHNLLPTRHLLLLPHTVESFPCSIPQDPFPSFNPSDTFPLISDTLLPLDPFLFFFILRRLFPLHTTYLLPVFFVLLFFCVATSLMMMFCHSPLSLHLQHLFVSLSSPSLPFFFSLSSSVVLSYSLPIDVFPSRRCFSPLPGCLSIPLFSPHIIHLSPLPSP